MKTKNWLNYAVMLMAVAGLSACGKKTTNKPATATNTSAINQQCAGMQPGQTWGTYNPYCAYNPYTNQYTGNMIGGFGGQTVDLATAKAQLNSAFGSTNFPLWSTPREYTYTFSNNVNQTSVLGGLLTFNFSYGTGWSLQSQQYVTSTSAAAVVNLSDNPMMPSNVQAGAPIAIVSGSRVTITYQGNDSQYSYQTVYTYDTTRHYLANPVDTSHVKSQFYNQGGLQPVAGTRIVRQ